MYSMRISNQQHGRGNKAVADQGPLGAALESKALGMIGCWALFGDPRTRRIESDSICKLLTERATAVLRPRSIILGRLRSDAANILGLLSYFVVFKWAEGCSNPRPRIPTWNIGVQGERVL